MKRFVIGDIHGAYHALRQCLERSGFDYENDLLISLGDVTDGWPETKRCIDELLKIKNLQYVLGNHDFWTLEWMQSGWTEETWLQQGGRATIDSYKNLPIPTAHVDLLKYAQHYYVIDNKLFVHAGINPHQSVEVQSLNIFLWDRNLARTALDFYQKGITGKFTSYDEVYIGHTPIPYATPIQSSEIWMMDTGAGWSGVLSLMNIDSKEVYISDPVPHLYPGVNGRIKRSD
jgi:serine/threonine protein phosphatase 1